MARRSRTGFVARSAKSSISRSDGDQLHDAHSRDLVLIMEFASAEALRAYQRHPDQLAVMGFNDPFVANVAAVDFTRT